MFTEGMGQRTAITVLAALELESPVGARFDAHTDRAALRAAKKLVDIVSVPALRRIVAQQAAQRVPQPDRRSRAVQQRVEGSVLRLGCEYLTRLHAGNRTAANRQEQYRCAQSIKIVT